MNTRVERKKYISRFLNYAKTLEIEDSDTITLEEYVEEFFIIECTKNKYAMEYVQNIIKTNEIKLDVDFVGLYHIKVLFSQAYDRIGYILDVLSFLKYAEDNDINLIRSLCIKSFKNITRAVESRKEDDLDMNTVTDEIVLFLFSLFNRDILTIDEDTVYDLAMSTGIVVDSVLDISIPKESGTALIEKYSLSLSKLGIDPNSIVTIQSICDYCIEKTSVFVSNHIDNSVEIDENFIFNNKLRLLERQEYLRQELLKNNMEYHMFIMAEFITETVEDSFFNSYFIMNYKITKEILVESLYILDRLCNRNYIDVNAKEKDLVLVLVNRVVNEILKDVITKKSSINLDLIKLHGRYHTEISNAHSKNEVLNSNLNDALAKISVLEKKIDNLSKEKDVLRATINKEKSKRKKDNNDKVELEALRALFFSLEYPEVACDLDDINDEVIINKKIAFVGSNNTLHSKLKSKFDIVYVTGDEQTRDLGFLKNMEHIFLHTHMPHALYYKVFEIIKSTNVGITFLNATNIDILNREMRKELAK